jgi:peptide/nickel transport system substrate-binding protein
VTARENMLRNGEADILMWATEQVADDLKDDPNVRVSVSPSGRFVMRLFINLAARGSTDPQQDPNPYFSNARVRQAIRSAIDVDRIASTVWYGFATPVWTELFRPPYNTCNIPRPAFDPEAAGTLLDEAGWILGTDGIRQCQGCQTADEGTKFRFQLLTYSEYGEPLIQTQQLIAEMLGDVGIQADLTQVQGSVLWADSTENGLEQTGNFDVDLYDDGYAGNDPTDFLWQYYHSASAEPDNGWNVGRWMNPRMDELIENSYTLIEADRQSAFCEMAQILDAELPQILLFSSVNADAYSTRVQGIQANVNSVVSWNADSWSIVK